MTVKQIQCLLAYLGYYKGVVDGCWGEQSYQATQEFQRAYGLIPDGIFGEATQHNASGRLSERKRLQLPRKPIIRLRILSGRISVTGQKKSSAASAAESTATDFLRNRMRIW